MLFELVLEGTYLGQSIINRWNYISSSTPAAVTLSFGLAAAFGVIPDGIPPAFPADSIFAKLQAIQNTSMLYTQLVSKNVYELEDFYAAPFAPGTSGGVGGSEAASPAVAYGLKSNQVTRAIRAGHKRFCGVSNNVLTNGGNLNSLQLANLQLVADLMSAPINYVDEGTTLTYIPVVVSKDKQHPPGKTTWAYYYYPTLAEQSAHWAQSPLWSAMPQVRTQTSRQYGRGK